MDWVTVLPLIVIVVALGFNFTNGFNDSANQVATVISSQALSPEIALVLAALGNFIGAWFLGTQVAVTIGRDIVNPFWLSHSPIGLWVILSALFGAFIWNLLSWMLRLPSSSSHALIGGLIGAFSAGWGIDTILWHNVIHILIVMVLAPFVGFGITYVVARGTFYCAQFLSPKAIVPVRMLEIFWMFLQSVAHGTNDAQKTMGVIALALVLSRLHPGSGTENFLVPQWVVLICSIVMALGILCGGWRIIRTLGAGLYRIRALHSLCAEASSVTILFGLSIFGFPVSSTEVISSSILGAGAAFRAKSVRWSLAAEMLSAWLVTIPIAAAVSATSVLLLKKLLFSGIMK